MISVLLLVSSLLTADPDLLNAMPLHAAEEWQVDVGPGSVTIDGAEIALADPVRLVVPKVDPITVKDETCTLPLFNEKASGWTKGVNLRALVTQECTATGLLLPESVVVKKADGAVCALGKDYAFDPLWGSIGRLELGAIAADEKVLIDYTYGPARLDSIVINDAGQVRLIQGKPGLGVDLPPAPGKGEHFIGSVWNPGNARELTSENLLPVEQSATATTPPEIYPAEQFLPRTLAKLQAGEPVKIVAWGDSCTAGGGVGGGHDPVVPESIRRAPAQAFSEV